MFLGKIYTRTVFLSVYCLFFNKRNRFYVAHLTFFLLFLFYPLSFVESHIAVLLDSSYLNIPNHYFHSSAVTFHYIVPFACRWASIVLQTSYLKQNDTQHLACPSPSDGHDVPCLSIWLSGILLFVSVTELFLFRLLHLWLFRAKRVQLLFPSQS